MHLVGRAWARPHCGHHGAAWGWPGVSVTAVWQTPAPGGIHGNAHPAAPRPGLPCRAAGLSGWTGQDSGPRGPLRQPVPPAGGGAPLAGRDSALCDLIAVGTSTSPTSWSEAGHGPTCARGRGPHRRDSQRQGGGPAEGCPTLVCAVTGEAPLGGGRPQTRDMATRPAWLTQHTGGSPGGRRGGVQGWPPPCPAQQLGPRGSR